MNNLRINISKSKTCSDGNDILINKNNTCQFCTAELGVYKHKQIKAGTWGESCSLCFYFENLDLIKKLDKGIVIMCPEISQVEINNFYRLYWYYQELSLKNYYDKQLEDYISQLRIFHNDLVSRKKFANLLFAKGSSDVSNFIEFYHKKILGTFDEQTEPLKHLRWIPNKECFLEEIDFWNNGEMKKYKPCNLRNIF